MFENDAGNPWGEVFGNDARNLYISVCFYKVFENDARNPFESMR